MPLDFGALRRHPDVEGRGLEASDAADRLILDESAALAAGLGPGELVVVDDAYGALALGSAAGAAAAAREQRREPRRRRARETSASTRIS